MIKLTRLDGEVFILNAELIRYVESRPDTYVTLVSNERLLVRESMDDVMRRAIEYQQSKQLLPAPQSAPRRLTAAVSSQRSAVRPTRHPCSGQRTTDN